MRGDRLNQPLRFDGESRAVGGAHSRPRQLNGSAWRRRHDGEGERLKVAHRIILVLFVAGLACACESDSSSSSSGTTPAADGGGTAAADSGGTPSGGASCDDSQPKNFGGKKKAACNNVPGKCENATVEMGGQAWYPCADDPDCCCDTSTPSPNEPDVYLCQMDSCQADGWCDPGCAGVAQADPDC